MRMPKEIFESDEFQGQAWYQGCSSEMNILPDIEGNYDFKKLDEMEKSGKYVAEYKGDGNWNAFFKSGDSNRHWSRSQTEKYYPIESWKHIPDGTILVGEVMRGSQFAVKMVEKYGYEMLLLWDVLAVDYKITKDLPAENRRRILEQLLQEMPKDTQDRFRLMPRFTVGFANEYLNQHEGLVLKYRDEAGYIGCGRKVPHWIKAKKSFESDAVILGYEKSIAASKASKDLTATIVVGLYGDFTEEECNAEFKKWSNNKNYVGIIHSYELTIPSVGMTSAFMGKRLKPVCAVTSGDHKLGEKLVKEWDYWKEKVLKVHHFGAFESGSYRHPSAMEGVHALRDDKKATECVFNGVEYKLM